MDWIPRAVGAVVFPLLLGRSPGGCETLSIPPRPLPVPFPRQEHMGYGMRGIINSSGARLSRPLHLNVLPRGEPSSQMLSDVEPSMTISMSVLVQTTHT